MKQKESTYNGWSNYATWVVNLWLTSDQENYQHYRELVKMVPGKHEFARMLAEVIDAGNPLYCTGGLYCDLLKYATAQVDYYEVASDFLEAQS